jgi:DNA polymerase-3 subunit epsilon
MQLSDKQKQSLPKILASVMSLDDGPEFIKQIMSDQHGLATKLIIAREHFPEVDDPVRLSMSKKAVIADTETTGLDYKSDEIIQLAMIEVFYDDQGIIKLGELFDQMNEPSKPIPEEVANLTGITDDMVKGQKIDQAEVKAFVGDAQMMICHNSEFDRKFLEAQLPEVGFNNMDFFCSMAQVDWEARGCNSAKLELIALNHGYVYGAHRADADILATAFVLADTSTGEHSAFCEMLKNGETPGVMIIADRSPFETKDALKARGYRWSATGEETFGVKAWFKEVNGDPETLEAEAEFIKEIYGRDVSIPSYEYDPKSRFSARRPGCKRNFKTAEVKSMQQDAQMQDLDNMMGSLL